MPVTAPPHAARASDRALGWVLALSPLAIIASFILAVVTLGGVATFGPKAQNPQSGRDEMGGFFAGMLAGFAVANVTLCIVQIVIAIVVSALASRQIGVPGARVWGALTIGLAVAAGLAAAVRCAMSLAPDLMLAVYGQPVEQVIRWAPPTLSALAVASLLALLRRHGILSGRVAALPLLALTGLVLLIPSVPILDQLAAFYPPALLGALWLRALRV